MQDPGFNWAYMYGLSDFWTRIFEDPELFGGLYNATSIQMAKAYNKFLSLTSGISLDEVQVNASSETELITLLVPTGEEEELTFTLDKLITSAQFIGDRPILSNVVLENGVEFDIEQIDPETSRISFSKPIAEFGFPHRETDEGTEYALWASDCLIDEGMIYSQFAKLIRVDPEISTNMYKEYIRGLYFLYTNGPNLSYIEQGINLALGVPVARVDEVVFLTSFDEQQGTWIVVTNKNSYVLPYGISPNVSRGDILKPGDSIAGIIEIQDFTSDGDWWLDVYLPSSVLPEGVGGGLGDAGRIASAGSPAYELMAKYLKSHTFLVKIQLDPGSTTGRFDTLRELVEGVKPAYTLGVYTWAIDLGEDVIEIVDDEFEVQPNTIKDDFIGFPAFHDRSILTVYPGGTPKTTRGTDKWFIKGNYSSDGRNVFNTPSSRVITPFHIGPSDYLGAIGPTIDSTKVVVTSRYQQFVSDGVNQTFNLKYTPISKYSVNVYVNGVYQEKASFYVYEHLLTALGNIPKGSLVEVVYLAGSNVSIKVFSLSGDGVSTSFSLPYVFPSENFVIVYENGIAINHTRYAISGTNITFSLPLQVGNDNVEIVVVEASTPVPALYLFSGDDSTDSFDTGAIGLEGTNVQVFINGVYQEKTKYTIVSGVIHFPAPPVSGTNNIEVIESQSYAPQISQLSSRKDKFSGTNSQTEFTLSYVPADILALQVFIGGVRMSPSAYSLGGVGNNTIIFSEAPPLGSFNIEVVYLVGDGVSYSSYVASGDGSTATFTLPYSITDPFGLSVYLNGVFQAPESYSVSGNVVTFTEAPIVGVDNVNFAYVSSDTFQTNVVTFNTDGIETVFNTGIIGVSSKYVNVYFHGVYQNEASYQYVDGVVTFYSPPFEAEGMLTIITSDYDIEVDEVIHCRPLYNLKTSELIDKLSSVSIPIPNPLPNRFAIYGYGVAPQLDSRDGSIPPVTEGNDYYSDTSDIYLENLLEVDSNGQTPEVNRSYYFSNTHTGIMLFEKCGDRVDLWTASVVGVTYQSMYFLAPEEDPLGIFIV